MHQVQQVGRQVVAEVTIHQRVVQFQKVIQEVAQREVQKDKF